MTKKEALRRLLQPKTVAVFGGNSAVAVVRQCKAIGFDGEIWAVSPSRTEMGGIPCVASIADLPGIPDASFVAAPPQASLQIIAELSALGAPGAVCFAAGFGEAGAEGEALQKQLREAIGDMAIIGPNCYGFVNYLDGVALWPDEHGGQRTQRGVALITQSGNIALNLTMQKRSLDYAYVISIGNNSTLALADYIELLLDDPRVTAIGLHIEGLRDIAGFSRAAIAALNKGIPIVALKTGPLLTGCRDYDEPHRLTGRIRSFVFGPVRARRRSTLRYRAAVSRNAEIHVAGGSAARQHARLVELFRRRGIAGCRLCGSTRCRHAGA